MPGGAGANLRRIAREAEAFPRRFVKKAAADVAKTIEKRVAADTGGDRILSGTTKRGQVTKLSVSKRVTGGGSVATATLKAGPQGRPVAMWHWLEYGTGEPGPTAAKHTWSKSSGKALEKASKSGRRAMEEVIR